VALKRLEAFRRSVLGGVVVLLAGAFGYMIIEKEDFGSALYMTAITVTTVGFKEAFPLSTEGRIFTMLLAFAGVGVILLIASQFGRLVLQADLRELIGENVMDDKVPGTEKNLQTIMNKMRRVNTLFGEYGGAKTFGETSQLLPYGVPLTAGTICVLLTYYLGGWL